MGKRGEIRQRKQRAFKQVVSLINLPDYRSADKLYDQLAALCKKCDKKTLKPIASSLRQRFEDLDWQCQREEVDRIYLG